MSESVSQYDHLVGGYPLDAENVEALKATSTEPKMLMMGDLPEKVDPREHPEAGNGFLQIENQGSIGSCQGNSLTECAEFCYYLAAGVVIQFSRMFAYIASQMKDGIRSDSGSTLSGGTEAAKDFGFCPESDAPYPGRYPGWGYITAKMRELAKKFTLQSHTVIRSAEQAKQYLGSGIGILQWGLSWGGSMDPDRDGCIAGRWSAGRGGHAICLVGYVKNHPRGRTNSSGYWFLLKNSWGKRWGDNGYAYVDPAVVEASLRHRWTVLLGRSDMKVPTPRKVDFTKENRFGFARIDFLLGLVAIMAIASCLITAFAGCQSPQTDTSWIPAMSQPQPLDDMRQIINGWEDLHEEKILARKAPRLGRPAVVIHTLPNGQCPPCEAWKRAEKPKLIEADIDVIVLEDARRAPTFDLFNGQKYFKRTSGYVPGKQNTAEQLLRELGGAR